MPKKNTKCEIVNVSGGLPFSKMLALDKIKR